MRHSTTSLRRLRTGDDGRVPDWPAVPLFAFLVVVATLRGGATYALGRGGRGVTDHYSEVAARPAVRRSEEFVRRYGPPAVTVSFLTVGVQTAVNLAAGALRMPLAHYAPALFAGALIWAAIYVTVGLAVLEALVGGHSAVLTLAGLAAVALVLVVGTLVRRRVLGRSGSNER
jgi:membrane protein DedA with SNARE-associated domain